MMKRIAVAGVAQGVSQLVQGSMMLGLDKIEYSMELLDAYVSVGGNAIDSGHIYGPDSAGAIGEWLEKRGTGIRSF